MITIMVFHGWLKGHVAFCLVDYTETLLSVAKVNRERENVLYFHAFMDSLEISDY